MATYDAFISYSRSDAAVAETIQTGLHRLARPLLKPRAVRVFRDLTTMPASGALGDTLEGFIEESDWLIVLCSETARDSDWVDKEIRHWLRSHDPSQLLVVVASGGVPWDGSDREIASGVPDVLLELGTEPAFIDVREADPIGGWQDGVFRSAVLTLSAAIRQTTPDELESEELTISRRARRLRRSAVVALAVLALATTVGFFLAVQSANQAREQAAIAETRAFAARAQLESNPLLAGLLALQAVERTTPAMTEARASYAQVVRDYGNAPALQLGQPLDVGAGAASLTVSPSGRFAAAAEADRIRIIDLEAGDFTSREFQTEPGQTITDIAFIDDASLLLGFVSGMVGRWYVDSDSFDPFPSAHQSPVTALLPTQRPGVFWSGAYEGDAVQWSNDAAATIVPFAPLGGVWSVAAHPDDEFFAFGLGDSRIVLWSESAGVTELIGHSLPAFRLEFSPDGRLLASAGLDGDVRLWSVPDGSEIWLNRGAHENTPVQGLAFTPDSLLLVSSGSDGAIRFWNVAAQAAYGDALLDHSGNVTDIRLALGGRVLVSSATDGEVRRWALKPVHRAASLSVGEQSINEMAFAADDSTLLIARADGFSILDTSSEELNDVSDHHILTVSTDGSTVALGDDASVSLFDVDRGGAPEPLGNVAEGPVRGLATSGDGGVIAAYGSEPMITLWWLEDGQVDRTETLPTSKPPSDVVIDAAGSKLAAAIEDSITTWSLGELGSGSTMDTSGRVASLAVSPGGESLALGLANGAIAIVDWDGDSPSLASEFDAHAAPVLDVAISPDGATLYSVAQSLRAWDLNLSEPLSTSITTGASMTAVAISPDGSTVAVGGFGGEVWLFDDQPPAELCRVINEHLEGVAEAPCMTGPGAETLPPVAVLPRLVSGSASAPLEPPPPGRTVTTTTTTHPPARSTTTTPPPTTTVAPQLLASGLLCRDLVEAGFGAWEALAYWVREGRPSRMDADQNGVPCETVFPAANILAVLFFDGGELEPGLFCADLVSRGFDYWAALAYWVREGTPDRMDADGDGIPCATRYDDAEIGTVLFFELGLG